MSKHIRNYAACFILLIATYALALGQNSSAGELVKSTTGYFPTELWNPIIVERVNESPIQVYMDDEQIDTGQQPIFMDEELRLMAGEAVIQDIFNCALDEYGSGLLVIEKNDIVLRIRVADGQTWIDEEVQADYADIQDREGERYLSVMQIAEWLGFAGEWDADTNQIQLAAASQSREKLPASFDYRDKEKKPQVRNQGSFGTCWALASLSALETALLPLEDVQFAADHMSIHNSFDISQNAGGDYTMAMAYLAGWQGPVLESDDPYGDGESPEGLEAVKHVQEIQLPAEKDYEAIKEAVYRYGAVQSSIYMALENPSSTSMYYNKENQAYCYIGERESNHDVIIIGWDDDFPASNFEGDVEEDGAFICQNSWGEEFADDGIFYISYQDSRLGIHNAVYTLVEETDNYDQIYQSDLCGWIGQIGYNEEKAYFANIYTAEARESLAAVGFYATGANTRYTIYVVEDFQGEESFEERRKIQSGTFKNAGFYTVDLLETIEVEAGDTFAVVIQIETPDTVHPVAIEYQADQNSQAVDLSDGQGYISLRGDRWESTEENHDCNVCLKVYTNLSEQR